nr:endonuclease III [Ardenticatena sp.]
MPKKAFDIDEAMRRVEVAVRPFPQAALFELAEEGHTSVFEILVACILSIRTRDEVTLPVARALFAQARTPSDILALGEQRLDALIRAVSFHERKAAQIMAIAREAVDRFGGRLPCNRETLLAFKGVGPKCANLTLAIACGEPFIAVDIHVHRITNRWGYVNTRTPEETLHELEKKLPRRYWIDINRLLVPFGKFICTGTRPRCLQCPLADMCARVGVATALPH